MHPNLSRTYACAVHQLGRLDQARSRHVLLWPYGACTASTRIELWLDRRGRLIVVGLQQCEGARTDARPVAPVLFLPAALRAHRVRRDCARARRLALRWRWRRRRAACPSDRPRRCACGRCGGRCRRHCRRQQRVLRIWRAAAAPWLGRRLSGAQCRMPTRAGGVDGAPSRCVKRYSMRERRHSCVWRHQRSRVTAVDPLSKQLFNYF